VRLSSDGKIVWIASGEDIFTGGFELLSGCIRVVDFNGTEYRFSYETGSDVA
jgi:hypothetical protein